MLPSLAAAIAPVTNIAPTDPLHWHNWHITLTEPVAVPCRARIGFEPYDEAVVIDRCEGSGPYVCHLVEPLQRVHMAGTPVTVLDGA